jgi:hypothetical protein
MHSNTLFAWYSGVRPILKPSGFWHGIALLSFRDLEEAYKVHLLRSKYERSLQYLRKAMQHARELTGSDHPLLDHEIDVMQRLALIIPGRGKRSRRAITLGDPSVPDYCEFSASVRDGSQVALLGSWSRRRAAEGEPHEHSSHSRANRAVTTPTGSDS